MTKSLNLKKLVFVLLFFLAMSPGSNHVLVAMLLPTRAAPSNVEPISFKSYKCLYCNHMSDYAPALMNHIKLKHPNKSVKQCIFCLELFKSWSERIKHFLDHHRDSKYLCVYCFKKFESKEYLLAHIHENHSRVKTVFCNLCNDRFVTDAQLQDHQLECSVIDNLFFNGYNDDDSLQGVSLSLANDQGQQFFDQDLLNSTAPDKFSNISNNAMNLGKIGDTSFYNYDDYVMLADINERNEIDELKQSLVTDFSDRPSISSNMSNEAPSGVQIQDKALPFKCDLDCDKSYESQLLLDMHKLNRHRMGKHKSWLSQDERAKLAQAIKSAPHFAGRTFKPATLQRGFFCLQCKNLYGRGSRLKKHLKKAHPTDNYNPDTDLDYVLDYALKTGVVDSSNTGDLLSTRVNVDQDWNQNKSSEISDSNVGQNQRMAGVPPRHTTFLEQLLEPDFNLNGVRHQEGPSYKCLVCPARFDDEQKLFDHLRTCF